VRALETEQIVAIWEKGQGALPADVAMLFLCAAFPGKAPKDLLPLTVGQRDACVLRLRELTLGSHMEAMAECPHCSEHVEFSFETADVQFGRLQEPVPLRHRLREDGWDVTFRPLTAADVMALKRTPDVGAARRSLIASSILEVRHKSDPATPDGLPEKLLDLIGAAIAEHDPQSEVPIRLNCPACGSSCSILFDAAQFFFRELTAVAERILSEVPILAKAYGWSESEILAMTPVRRRFYLDAAG